MCVCLHTHTNTRKGGIFCEKGVWLEKNVTFFQKNTEVQDMETKGLRLLRNTFQGLEM